VAEIGRGEKIGGLALLEALAQQARGAEHQLDRAAGLAGEGLGGLGQRRLQAARGVEPDRPPRPRREVR
jgi:hypothetical protein